MKTKIILDTDIGSDIDDAVCLAYLLAQPQCDLLGITTVTGQATERAMMADAVCREAGKAVPIFPGIEKPMLVTSRQPAAQQAKMLRNWPHRKDFPQGQAIEFLRQTIRANPHEVVLLAIGPLTNIAALFLLDPEIPSLLKSLVLMGGNFAHTPWYGQVSEWNILNDPHAAAMVYRASVPILRSIGVDITMQARMDVNDAKRQFARPGLRTVLDFALVWFEGEQKKVTFHDPLAAATIFAPEICQFQRGQVDVELQSEALAGFTHWKPGNGPHEVAVTVDVGRFFDHYFAPFGPGASAEPVSK